MPYKLPSDLEPTGVQCIRVYVPDDVEWRSLFWGAFSELARWFNYEKDGTENGAQVARLWRTLYLQSEAEFIEGGGCGLMDVRVKPDDSCILQKSTDGETWEDWANLDDCGVSMRVNPTTCLLEFDCGGGNWKPVFTDDHPEGQSEPPYPSGSDEYEADTARCIAAANIASQLKYGTDTLAHDAVIVGGLAIAIINLIGAFLFFVPGGILVDIAIAIIDVAVGHVASDFSDDFPAIDWEDVRDQLSCMIERDGSVTEAERSAFLSWMATVYSGNLAWELTKIIVQNVNADGLTTSARMPQDDIDITGCPTCGCDLDINFEDTDGTFYAVAPGFDTSHTYGIYVSGQGWQNEFDASQGYACNINALALIPEGCVTVRIEVDVEWNNDYYPFFKLYDPTTGYVFIDEYNAGHGTGLYTYVWTGSRDFRDLGIFNRNTNGGAPYNYIKAVRIFA